MSQLSIVIVSYNTRDLLAACLHSVLAETAGPPEVLVVDNGSVDGSARMVADDFPAVRLIALDHNAGFARAANVGVAASTGAMVCLLNPDTVVHDGALDRLARFCMDHPEAGICGGRTLRADGTVDPSSCWARPTLWSLVCFATGLTTIAKRSPWFDPESMGRWERDTIRPVDIVTGCLLAVPRPLWDRLGGFDERFFLYGEDADLSLRAAALGYRPCITPDATVTHFVGAATSSSVHKGRYLLAGKVTLIDKHWSPVRAALGRRLLVAGIMVRAALGGPGSAPRRLWAERAEWARGYPPPGPARSVPTGAGRAA